MKVFRLLPAFFGEFSPLGDKQKIQCDSYIQRIFWVENSSKLPEFEEFVTTW
jgi:hypothetical protein